MSSSSFSRQPILLLPYLIVLFLLLATLLLHDVVFIHPPSARMAYLIRYPMGSSLPLSVFLLLRRLSILQKHKKEKFSLAFFSWEKIMVAKRPFESLSLKVTTSPVLGKKWWSSRTPFL